MDKDEKVILGIIFTCLIMIVALSILGHAEKQAYRLTLTNEGCTFAASIGLPVEKSEGQCWWMRTSRNSPLPMAAYCY